MEEKFPVSVQRWPGGITTFAGGTRTAVKVVRPWQMAMPINPASCPFEPAKLSDKHEISMRSEDGQWVAFNNLFTPLQFHQVMVPTTCADWPDHRLRLLGGREEIGKALDLAHKVLALNERTNRGQEHIVTHNGFSAGQNQPHIHWHSLTYPEAARGGDPFKIQQELLEITADSKFFVLVNGNLKVMAGGHRAGECFILPEDPSLLISLENIANTLHQLMELFVLKFRSRVGAMLPPDFTLDLVFVHNQLAYGAFVPMLNNMGSTEYVGMLGQQAMTLPWPHDKTAAYLRGEIGLE